MTISIITGLPGFGKTLKLCEFAYKAMLQGKHVYFNCRMQNLPRPELYHHFNDPLEVLGKVSNALVLISEVGIVLDQQIMYQIPRDMWIELRQHRKDGVNIIADAQSKSDVAWTFMNLVQFQFDIYAKYKVFGKTFQLVRVFNPKTRESYGRRYWIHNPKYFHYYDTNYKLEKTPSLFEISQEQIESPWAQYLDERYQVMLLNQNIDLVK